LLEKYLERKIIFKAKKLGYLTYKFVSPSNRGVPDRIFISENGKLFFVEFKSKKGKLSKLQEKKISELKARKQSVFVVNDEELAMKILTEYMIDVTNKN
jgi:hypothetical protein